MMPMTACSATALALAGPALATGIPFSLAASTSMLSYPALGCWTSRQRVVRSITSRSTWMWWDQITHAVLETEHKELDLDTGTGRLRERWSSITERTAAAERIAESLKAVANDEKWTVIARLGDALGVARVAGIMAAKRTSDLIPLCHPLPITSVAIDFEFIEEGVRILATARVTGRTGVEMEALTAAAVAGLTVIDMVKGLEPGVWLEAVRLLEKSGGKSGVWKRQPPG